MTGSSAYCPLRASYSNLQLVTLRALGLGLGKLLAPPLADCFYSETSHQRRLLPTGKANLVVSMDDDYVFVSRPDEAPALAQPELKTGHLAEIERFIEQLAPALWPLNCFIHNNPELGYQEFQAHDALTKFMKSRPGWAVTRSAYGLPTAWEAVFDTGRAGPVVSFNAEMGKKCSPSRRDAGVLIPQSRCAAESWPRVWT